jgi:hypothetical protein
VPRDEKCETDMLLYHADKIASLPNLGFTPDDHIFMALLSGGDYSVIIIQIFSGVKASILTSYFLAFLFICGQEWSVRLWNQGSLAVGEGGLQPSSHYRRQDSGST